MNLLKAFDFTLPTYKKICEEIIKNNYTICNVSQYLKNKELQQLKKVVILRHDIDTYPTQNTLKMAKVEKKLGISSTYYFRKHWQTFHPKVIQKVKEMGHEIGYHYETLSKAKGDYEKAIGIFKKELDEFRKICTVKTICMHGRSFSEFDNRDLWKKYNFKDYGIIGEPYLSFDYSKIIYFSDTGRVWDPYSKFKIRDRVNMCPVNLNGKISSSNDLINFIKKNQHPILILAHPQSWATNFLNYICVTGFDYFVNIVKIIIRKA